MKAVFKSTSGKEPPKDSGLAIPAGEYIFREGDLGTDMFIIQEGEVHITKHLGSEDRVLTRLEKGDFFGEMAILESAPRSADALAHTDVKLIPINGSRFDEMIRRNPEISVRIMRKYSRRIREANLLLQKFAGGAHVDLEHPQLPSPAEAPQRAATRHRIVDLATGNAFFFGRDAETTIGRIDPVTGILPGIDLTTVDTNRSVSRRHAKIVSHAGSWAVLEEVGTLNGTFVNEDKIPTGVPVPISHGDRLRIGLVQMKVVLEE